MKKRGQVSVEFMVIIAISMMILLPSVYMFRNYVMQSSDQILKSRLNELSDMVLLKAKKMHYYGPPSKSTIELDMPPQIDNMYITAVPDNNEYYLGFTILTSHGTEEVTFYSDIPIRALETKPCDFCNSYSFCECMIERYYSKGPKNIQVTSTVDCNYGEDFCVSIGDFSPDLN